jgi:G:T-mismatch repair DNA endonuclease (very short patch repair protein)
MQNDWRVLLVWECVVPTSAEKAARLQHLMHDWIVWGKGSAEIGPSRPR